MSKHFLHLTDYTTHEIWELLHLAKELKIKFKWSGKGINTKCFNDKGQVIVQCDKAYFRPLEVDTLLGDSRKARKELKWKSKIDIKTLVKDMINSEIRNISNDQN